MIRSRHGNVLFTVIHYKFNLNVTIFVLSIKKMSLNVSLNLFMVIYETK